MAKFFRLSDQASQLNHHFKAADHKLASPFGLRRNHKGAENILLLNKNEKKEPVKALVCFFIIHGIHEREQKNEHNYRQLFTNFTRF